MASYILPVADRDRLGGIKVGEDFKITDDGILNIKDMDDLREQVAALSQIVAEGKEQIATAITDKGIPTAATDIFSVMAENIRKINSDGVKAGAADYTIYTVGKIGVAGMAEYEGSD